MSLSIRELKSQKQALRGQAQSVDQRRAALRASFNLNWGTRPAWWRSSPEGRNFYANWKQQDDGYAAQHRDLLQKVFELDDEIAQLGG